MKDEQPLYILNFEFLFIVILWKLWIFMIHLWFQLWGGGGRRKGSSSKVNDANRIEESIECFIIEGLRWGKEEREFKEMV